MLPKALISLPLEATLRVGDKPIPCVTHSMSAQTDKSGVRGEIVYLGDGAPARLQGIDPRGKIALFDGIAAPKKVKFAQELGFGALVFANASDLPVEMIVSWVWGSPTHESLSSLPQIPVVSITRQSRDVVLNLIGEERVNAVVTTKVLTEWRPIPLITVEVPGREEGRFALLNGMWIPGITVQWTMRR
jgi:hypothetical protein